MDKYNDLYQIAADFRRGIDLALNTDEFLDDIWFRQYPRGCCGDTSILLGHHLLNRGIKSYYVCGHYRQGNFEEYQSHAWLITENGTIIDITGDQFKYKERFHYYDIPIYVGENDDFHNLFEVEPRDVKISVPLDQIGCLDEDRLPDLYKTIVKYI